MARIAARQVSRVSSFRRVKTQEGFDAFTHRSPPAGEIGTCGFRPAVRRWHVRGLARIPARPVGRTEAACGGEPHRRISARPVCKAPQWLSALPNPLLPATLRAPEAPPPCEPGKPPGHTLGGFLWYGHAGTLPAAAGCGAVVRKGSVRNLCMPPAFYSCFGQLYPVLHRRSSSAAPASPFIFTCRLRPSLNGASAGSAAVALRRGGPFLPIRR